MVAQAPLGQLFQLAGLGGAERVGDLRLAQPVGLVVLPQALFFVGLALTEDVVVVVVGQSAAPADAQVVADGHAERERAGQKSLLEQHGHDVAARLGAVLFGAARDDVVEQGEHCLLAVLGGEFQDVNHAVLKQPGVFEVAFEPADGDVFQCGGVEDRAAGKAARIDHFHQRGERLRVAVVRCCAQEQAVFAFVGELAHRHRALGVHRIASAAGRR